VGEEFEIALPVPRSAETAGVSLFVWQSKGLRHFPKAANQIHWGAIEYAVAPNPFAGLPGGGPQPDLASDELPDVDAASPISHDAP
jgi:hypothetical protein